MVSSPEESDLEQTTTPVTQTANPAETVLSPPDSQRRERSLPTTSLANSNGKRPLQNISNGADDMEGAYIECRHNPVLDFEVDSNSR